MPTLSRIPQTPIHLCFVRIPPIIRTRFHTDPEGYATAKPVQIPPAAVKDILSIGESTLANRFRTLKKQAEWVAGRIAVKHLVQRILSKAVPLPHIRVATTPEGAPFLSAYPRHALSITHGGSWAVAALAAEPGWELGIDIEPDRARQKEAFSRIALSQRESTMLIDSSDTALTTHWTLKEATLKLIKKGFHQSLQHLEVLEEEIFLAGIPFGPLSRWTHLTEDRHILSAVFAKNLPHTPPLSAAI